MGVAKPWKSLSYIRFSVKIGEATADTRYNSKFPCKVGTVSLVVEHHFDLNSIPKQQEMLKGQLEEAKSKIKDMETELSQVLSSASADLSCCLIVSADSV